MTEKVTIAVASLCAANASTTLPKAGISAISCPRVLISFSDFPNIRNSLTMAISLPKEVIQDDPHSLEMRLIAPNHILMPNLRFPRSDDASHQIAGRGDPEAAVLDCPMIQGCVVNMLESERQIPSKGGSLRDIPRKSGEARATGRNKRDIQKWRLSVAWRQPRPDKHCL
jgi:hypothetical protein